METFVLARRLVGHRTLFVLRVRGDSMTGTAITDGDLVVVRQQPAAENYVTTRDYEAVRTIKIKKSGSLGHPRGGP